MCSVFKLLLYLVSVSTLLGLYLANSACISRYVALSNLSFSSAWFSILEGRIYVGTWGTCPPDSLDAPPDSKAI